jgi:hypothetical protein
MVGVMNEPPAAAGAVVPRSDTEACEPAGAVSPSAATVADRIIDRLVRVRPETVLSLVVVALSMVWILSTLHWRLILTDTTPTGGDMGAHVWSPAFLRDHLLPNGTLIGWTPDWYAGFPAFQFYMILPSLAVVLLNVGLAPWAAVLTVGAALAGLAWLYLRPGLQRWRGVAFAATILVAVLSIGMPYGIAFKIVVVSGLVTMPLSAWAMGRLSGLAFPGPVLLAVATLPFVFDRSFNIYGGNIASTMAGEFAFSMALSLSLVAIGATVRALETGKGRGWAALLLTLTGLCHLFPAFFALGVVGVFSLLRFGRSQVRAMLAILSVGGALGAFWALPFLLKHTYMNDMGWGKLFSFKENLLTRNTLPSAFLRDSPPLEVVFALAVAGLVLCLLRGNRLGIAFAVGALVVALAFIHRDEGRLWNGRMLPFYYLSLYFLAALAVFEAVQLVRERRWARWFAAWSLAGVVVTELLRAGAAGRSYEENIGRMLPGPSTNLVAVILLVVLASVLWRRHAAAPGLAAVAGLVWIGAFEVDPRWWTTASGAEGFVAVAGESVLRPGAYAVLHALEYPAAYLLVGMIALGLVDLGADTSALVRMRSGRAVHLLAAPVAFLGIFLVLGPPLRSVPFGSAKTDGTYEWGLPFWKHETRDVNFLPSWAKWNFEGLERKQASGSSGGYPEYYELIEMTKRVGADPALGCGRAMWEYGARLEGYGTPMAPMLIPHFTDGCIGSMEGLYFEASSTTPHHFLNQSALSEKPSSPQRDLPYTGFDIDLGVKQLQFMGVRYYLAYTDKAVTAALGHPDLEQIGTAGVWHMFLVRDSDLVSPLTNEPVVYTNVDDTQKQWLQPAARFFVEPAEWDVLRAADGPASWARFTIPETAKLTTVEAQRERLAAEAAGQTFEDPTIPSPPRTALPPVTVSNITSGRDTLSFQVDRPGVPVLVKVSYFPNWKVTGGEGPYRVTPNLMVVVPTAERVELTYAQTGVDRLAQLLTLLGLVGLVLLFRARPQVPAPAFFDPLGPLAARWARPDPAERFDAEDTTDAAAGGPDGPNPGAAPEPPPLTRVEPGPYEPPVGPYGPTAGAYAPPAPNGDLSGPDPRPARPETAPPPDR